MSQNPLPSHDDLVVVGAGVSACALAASLRHRGWGGSLTLVEAGRGVGGRCASRRSRRHPGALLNHGAPGFGIDPQRPPELLQPLLASGHLVPLSDGLLVERLLDSDHRLLEAPGPCRDDGIPHRGVAGMEDLAIGLLELADQARASGGPAAGAPAVVRVHGRRVQQLQGGGEDPWRLLDGSGDTLAAGRWLVLSGTLLAHPRCLPLLDCSEIPLAAANRRLQDPQLDRALAAVASLGQDPRLALLFWVTGKALDRWQQLPFRQLGFTEQAQERWGLERVILQPQANQPELLGVVVQARPAALIRAQAATIAGELADAEDIALLSQALIGALAPWITADDLPDPEERQLMRWGGAFPLPPGLDPEAMVCPDSHLALCGDGIAGPGFGRVSGAWHSGEWLAGRLLPLLQAEGL